MNKALTLITITVFVSGCASTDYAKTPEERHQANKTQYYHELNQRQPIEAVALNEEQNEQTRPQR